MRKLALLSLLPALLSAIDLHYNPWFGNDKEFDFNPYYTLRHFNEVEECTLHDWAHLVGASASFTYAPDWFFYTQVDLAKTRQMAFGFDQWLGLINYRWCNDIAGDLYSLTTGVQLSINSRRSCQDFALYHSGEWEVELHSAIGKECASGQDWYFRGWLDVAFGLSNRGAPWLKGLFALESQFCHCHTLSLLSRGWIGFGGDSIRCLKPFHGYGPIAHHNLDVGFAYQYDAFCLGFFGLEFYYGAVSHNYPQNPLEFTLFWRYTFGP